MQPRAWLKLTNKTLTQVATDLGMKLVTVSRHFSGVRNPGPDIVRRYEDYTESAVRAEDWVELWNEPEAVAARHKEEAARLEREGRKAADDISEPVAASG